ncbi:MAG: LysR family transcriptional regulator [Sandaracinaceae bacterium]
MHRTAPRAADLHWDDVRLFLALCRARTLGEAARTLGVDGSTVSRRLAALEETVAASLFDRGRAGVAATPAAEALLPVAEEIEHAMARFAGAAEALERDVAGLVRVACPPDAAEVLVAPHLPDLLARYPGLRLELMAGEGLVDVSRRSADIALRIVRPEAGDLIIRKLAPVAWQLAAAPALANVLGTVRRFRDVPWVTFGDRFAHIPAARWVTAHAGVEPLVRSDSIRVQIAVVAAGVGAALLPAGSVTHYGFVPVKVAPKLARTMEPWPRDDLYLVTHRALRRVPRVSAVWELLLEKNPQLQLKTGS